MDTIANFLTSIRNGSSKGLEKVDVPHSKMKMALVKILKDEGFVGAYRMMEENKRPFIRIQLRYTDERKPVISGIKRVSRPGLHLYTQAKAISRDNIGMGIAIISTSKGVMTGQKARHLKIGGEIVCNVW